MKERTRRRRKPTRAWNRPPILAGGETREGQGLVEDREAWRMEGTAGVVLATRWPGLAGRDGVRERALEGADTPQCWGGIQSPLRSLDSCTQRRAGVPEHKPEVVFVVCVTRSASDGSPV